MNKHVRQGTFAAALFPIRHPIWWKTLRNIFTGAPTVTAALLAWRMTASNEATTLAKTQQEIKALFESNVSWIIMLLFAPIAISVFADLWDAAAKKVQEYQGGNLSAASVVQTTLLHALDEVVAKKIDRFSSYLRKIIASGEPPSGDVFSEITHPEQQIEEILAQLFNSLNVLLPSKMIKIVLVECRRSKPVKFFAFKPSDAHPDHALLADNSSFFHSIVASETPRAIPNLRDHCAKLKRRNAAKTLPKYLHIGDGAPEGSIVGYPVKNAYVNEKTFVLTLKCQEPDVFDEAFIRQYRVLIDAFVKRIQLEGCLLRIKNYAQQNYANDNQAQ